MPFKVPMQYGNKLTTHIISRILSWLLLLLLPAGLSVAQSSVSLLVIGDGGTGGRGAMRVGEAMAAQHITQPVQAVVSTGDNIYNSGVKSVDDPQWQSKFERVYPADNLPVPFWAVLGNHDYRGNPDAQVAYTRHRLPDGSVSRWRMPGR
ncbi:MAG: metallophosphoesterase, partial [Bacteroidetes bacterium]|nr:metallophosphoesterase [Bacteroidota bacterium]